MRITNDGLTKPTPAQEAKYKEAEQVAQDFETMFMDLILKTMRDTAKPEESTNAQDIYQGMLDSEYSKAMTGAKNFGVRDLVLNWMKNNDPDLKTLNTDGQKALQEMDKSKNNMKFAAAQYRMQTLPSGIK